MSERNFKVNFKYLIAIFWTLLIFTGCLVSSSMLKVNGVDNIVGFDKLAHFILYSVCSWLWMTALISNKTRKNATLYTISGLIILGFIIECLQAGLTKDRSFEFYDILANVAGTIFGTTIFLKLR